MKLETHSLSRRFGDHVALDELTFVSETNVLCLIGPSGGGKSTLLRILGGLDRPDSGKVFIDGNPLPTSERELMAYRRSNGFLFQQFNLFPHLTALQNLTLPLVHAHRMPEEKARAIALAALDRFGLAVHAGKHPSQLSGGQQQRVALARAVAAKPRILFLDEPTSALDPEKTAEVLDLINDLADEGQHIILSTHEMGFAKAVAGHVAFVAHGRIEDSGSPGKFFDSPSSPDVRRFLSRVMKY